ncbi:hypothetical protein QQM79_03700 [Marinobacteraceae bacterium S3BR75-40.1]
MRIEYKVKKGKRAGEIHTPHPYSNGTYAVSKTRFKQDQIMVKTLWEVVSYLERGYRVRVSHPATRKSPSLVNRASLTIS